MRKFVTLSTLLAASALLAACGSTKDLRDSFDTRRNAGPCPPTGAIYDVARVVEFDGSGKELYSNITFTGEVTDVKLYCRYVEDNPLEVELDVTFAFGKGPMADATTHTFPYFVAVTRRSGKVLAKQSFNVTADFSRDTVTARTENVNGIVIPRVDESISGANFEVLVGFELTDEQLEFNRAGKRFRLGAGE